MAKVSKVSKGRPTRPSGTKGGGKVTKPALALPTTMNTPSDSLLDYSILLYGAKKIGKTSLAARFPDALFLACEPGTKALRVYTVPITSWQEFTGYVDLILQGGHNFRTVVVDTADRAYEMAFDHVCSKMMIEHPNEENDYGATWKRIKKEFATQVDRLITSGLGVVFVSHDTEREVELRDGTKVDRVQPTMASQAMGAVEGQVDIIANYAYDGNNRILRIDGTQEVVSGCRVEEHFVRAGGKPRVPGDRIISIPMGKSAAQAYDNLVRAFENKQEEVEAYTTPTPSATKKKPAAVRKIGRKK